MPELYFKLSKQKSNIDRKKLELNKDMLVNFFAVPWDLLSCETKGLTKWRENDKQHTKCISFTQKIKLFVILSVIFSTLNSGNNGTVFSDIIILTNKLYSMTIKKTVNDRVCLNGHWYCVHFYTCVF